MAIVKTEQYRGLNRSYDPLEIAFKGMSSSQGNARRASRRELQDCSISKSKNRCLDDLRTFLRLQVRR